MNKTYTYFLVVALSLLGVLSSVGAQNSQTINGIPNQKVIGTSGDGLVSYAESTEIVDLEPGDSVEISVSADLFVEGRPVIISPQNGSSFAGEGLIADANCDGSESAQIIFRNVSSSTISRTVGFYLSQTTTDPF